MVKIILNNPIFIIRKTGLKRKMVELDNGLRKMFLAIPNMADIERRIRII